MFEHSLVVDGGQAHPETVVASDDVRNAPVV